MRRNTFILAYAHVVVVILDATKVHDNVVAAIVLRSAEDVSVTGRTTPLCEAFSMAAAFDFDFIIFPPRITTSELASRNYAC